MDNPAAGAPMLQIAFRVYPQEVAFPPLWLEPNQIFTSLHIIIPPDDISARFNAILSATPLYKMTEEDRKLVWKYREFISATRPACISKVLSSVDWTDIKQVPSLGSKKKKKISHSSQVREMYRLLSNWPTIDPVVALELLDAKFPDQSVRDFAVRCLDLLSDDELREYLLQLVRTL